MSTTKEVLRDLSARDCCPTCKGTLFFKGPMGGLSVNVKCAGCGNKYCYCPGFTMLAIDNEDWLYHGAAVTLGHLYD